MLHQFSGPFALISLYHKQKDALYNAFINNEQISWIAEDNDVNLFYSKLLNDDEKNDNAKQVHKMLVDRGENS